MAEGKAVSRALLKSYLNQRMRVAISDGRVIDGNFLCTDRDRNMVLGNCDEFSSEKELAEIEAHSSSHLRRPRTLGLAIVPGHHICSIAISKDALSQIHSPPTHSHTITAATTPHTPPVTPSQ